ncbi:ubiquitin-like-specific protease ESD4 isoform X1 [Magnolia sinica]|uniref:ubiquitin-like-specific protease ESD4 isoform X1 n=1 Tax=Magnolia sinica TaxID=86752 RepID=UPI002657E375|nr:ubiquitin-like-specific protease ESD4 isoform X1 [Magnolia sinica]XP_058075902.1 ubiquitin-like-specific protease ESD4 isoform X1 [Magnolia sinica]XP_058075903.1 ubiquitin-like-specific protease ESD4 isoform X1 [Magnolia sinica]XP_058075904.1 ubiquitin-like-specific protease ESD4 isoform X1 [Magnolia sinica]XP_058075905.1 ubiquitin-like-specific protease ESD4 isoform X1 [Magnolia sinica]
MGALTENRKRFIDNFSLSPAFASPYFSNPEFEVDLPPSKKLRIPSMPSVPDGPSSSEAPGCSNSRLRSWPPPQPLSRAVHAPQRSSKFSRPANPAKKSQTEGSGIGGVMGLFHGVNRVMARFGQWWWRKGEPAADTERLSKDNYQRLVEVQEGHSIVSDPASGDVCFPEPKVPDSLFYPSPSAVVSDLTGLTPIAEKGKTVDITNLVNHEVDETLVGRPPAYKELYESSKKRDPKLISLDFELRLTEKKMSSFKIASQAQEVKEVVGRDAFVALTDEEEVAVYDALFGPNRRGVLVTHANSNIVITKEKLMCLRPGEWLNDEVINLYLELLKEREKRVPKKFLKCHFFNTFFFKKLVSGKNGYDFKSVRRWTTPRKIGYGLIECDKIFVPIHREVHWCLAVINIKDKKFQYLDSLGGKDAQVLKVLNGSYRNFGGLNSLERFQARYFLDEVKEKSERDVDLRSWKQEFVRDLPEQQNGWDCGMFMIKYADFYSRGLELCFCQEDMPYFRKRTVKEILNLRAE